MRVLTYRILERTDSIGCRFEALVEIEGGGVRSVKANISESQGYTMTEERALVLAQSLEVEPHPWRIERQKDEQRELNLRYDVVCRVYVAMLKATPALCTDYTGPVPSRLGDSVRMIDGRVVTLDRHTEAWGPDLDSCVHQIVEHIRSYFGSGSTARYFVATALRVRVTGTNDALVHVIWGEA